MRIHFIKSLWHALGALQMLAGFITFILALQPIFQPLISRGCYFWVSFFPYSHLKINIVNLQHCVSFRCIAKWFSYTCVCVCVWVGGCEGKCKLVSRVRLFGPHGLYSPWNSPGQNTGVGSLSLLQGIFPTQGSNRGLPHCRWIISQLSHRGSPCVCVLYIYIIFQILFHYMLL